MSTVSSFLVRPASRSATTFESHAPEFRRVLGDDPRLRHVVTADAHEGPVYVPGEDALYFTSLPRLDPLGAPIVSISRLDLDSDRFPLPAKRLQVSRADANTANGMALDRDGSLVICEQGGMTRDAAIGRLDPSTLEHETVVDRWRGLAFNSPNDILVRSDGTLWFTDPSYGFLQGFRPEPGAGDHVYRFDPASGRIAVVADSLDKPNGLAFSPDEGVLYVTDSGANQEAGSYHADRPHHVVAFDVLKGRRLSAGRLFVDIIPGPPDGIKVDDAGRVYVSAGSGVQVFSAAGKLIGEIHLPGAVNFTFGGPQRNVLYITADTDIWAAVLNTTGGPPRTGPHTAKR